MGTGEQRIDQLGELEFHGKVGKNVAAYAKATQRFAHDMAYELHNSAEAAEAAMRDLEGHPLLLGLDVRFRAARVARKLRRAQELALAISAESVKFNQQYRQEFVDIKDRPRSRKHYQGKVDL